MELVDVTAFFDRTEFRDPASNALLFMGQIEPYDDSRRDNSVAYRRILSVAPGTTIPTGRVVKGLGRFWMVGAGQPDGFDSPIRDKYVIQTASGSVLLYTAAQFLAGAGAATMYGDLQWEVDRRELEVSSYVPQQYSVFLPPPATPAEHNFAVLGSLCVMVQNTFVSASGLRVAQGILQPSAAPGSAVVTTRTFNPATGAYTTGAAATVACAVVRWQEFYRYAQQADEKYQEGDMTLLLPASTTVSVSSSIVAGGITWTVISARAVSGVLAVHGRPR